eukprot:5860733-Prorocentrum_lima.AAC.1
MIWGSFGPYGMWGLEDAPRPCVMRLGRSLRESGYREGITNPQIWRRFATPAKKRYEGLSA